MNKLPRDFYLKDTLTVAKNLLGKNLVHLVNDTYRVGKIVETEAYIGPIDKACHAYNNKLTPRTEPLFKIGGTSYVYLIYGMYFCMNVVSEDIDIPCAILIRAIEPIEGINEMALDRFTLPIDKLSSKQVINLSNGPGKLCIAMGINKSQNQRDLLSKDFFISDSEDILGSNIIKSTRINIDYAEEAKNFLWRFYIKDNKYVSKK